jgi:hypothetical protein
VRDRYVPICSDASDKRSFRRTVQVCVAKIFQRVNLANDNGRVDLHCNRDPAAAVLIAENALSTGMPGFIGDRCQGDRAARRYRNLDWGESRSDLCMRRSFRSVQTVRKSLRPVDVNRPRMTIVGDGVRDHCSASRDIQHGGAR